MKEPACLLHAGHVIANKHRDERNAFILFLHAITRVCCFCLHLHSVKTIRVQLGSVLSTFDPLFCVDGIL
jgi:hypothetical protein